MKPELIIRRTSGLEAEIAELTQELANEAVRRAFAKPVTSAVTIEAHSIWVTLTDAGERKIVGVLSLGETVRLQ